MNVKDIRFLYEYNNWARDRILEQVARLSPQQFLESRPHGHGSIRNDLVHILSGEWVWRVRCQEGRSPKALLPWDEFPTSEALATRWLREEERMRGYLRGLTEPELHEEVTYQRIGGQIQSHVRWLLLVHVVNHGTEHRSTIAAQLTACGYAPGDLDIVHFMLAQKD